MAHLISVIVLISASAMAVALPNCADFPDGFFVNDPSNCQAYWYCHNAQSVPQPGLCNLPYNFDQSRQLCNHPDTFPCYDGPPTTPKPPIDPRVVAVNEHNYYRDIHGVPDVASFSNDINNFAQEWADYLASTDQFYHSSGSGFGENLYKAWGGTNDKETIVANAIKSFYSEIQYYDWNNPGFSSQTGHFTQVVWKASIEIGVGIATYPDANWGHRSVVSINYRPPGNYLGQFEQNVLPPRANRALRVNDTRSYDNELSPAKVMVL
ncbi:pathogenesis-related protein 1-like [Bradysia coprophila]|uniref:pathogenesis-related protein 1-like n=1 Tax=Bradysia coprophila TaxID=38358 RepID=UPI00187D9226|nr:pathogenesis-related protein 1-like [Bradysia coprophila]